MRCIFSLAVLAAVASLSPSDAQAARSYDNCTGFITALPATITTQGVWCLDQDLGTGLADGVAIDIATNNVTLDCNGFKLGNLAAGAGTATIGVRALGRGNITIRGCNVRGFARAIHLEGGIGGHVVEDNRIDGARKFAITVSGGPANIMSTLIVYNG